MLESPEQNRPSLSRVLHVDLEIRVAPEQLLQEHPALQPGQLRTDTVVNPAAEGQGFLLSRGDIEPVGVFKLQRVAIGGRYDRQHPLDCRDLLPGYAVIGDVYRDVFGDWNTPIQT